MGFLKNMYNKIASAQQKTCDLKINEAKKLILKLVDEKDILFEIAGLKKVLFLTKNDIYLVNVGQFGVSGKIGSNKVKSFSLKEITSVDVDRKQTGGIFQIITAGIKEVETSTPWDMKFQEPENCVMFPYASVDNWYELVKKVKKQLEEFK